MIRMLHFADIHIGIENYGRMEPETGLNSRVRDFLRRMDEMIAEAKARDVDLILFAGDAFKNRQPSPTLQREFAVRVREMAALCPVVLLVGNHDLPTNALRASSVEIFDTLAVPNVIVAQDYLIYDVMTKNGSVQVATAPYPIRANLVDPQEALGLSVSASEDLLLRKVIGKLQGMAAEVSQSESPRVLTGHFTIDQAQVGRERALMLGKDLAVPLSEVADPAWDYVAMGHIHRHQNLTRTMAGAPPVVYSGNLEYIDFGEEGDPKGFVWVELERGQTRWEFVRANCRPFVEITVDVRGLTDPMRAIQDEIDEYALTEAIVKVRIMADEGGAERIDERQIHAHLFHTAHVNFVAAIEKRVERSVRSRLGTSPEGLTPPELLEAFLRAKQTPTDQMQDLLTKAQEIFAADQSNLSS